MLGFRFVRAAPACVLMFPGQGSQHVGMAKDLADAYPIARATFEEADEQLGFSLSQLCFDGPEEALTDTVNAQPALLTASVATLRVIEHELTPALERTGNGGGAALLAGHSMGEYSALVAAGSLSFAQALHLVRERGRLMKLAGERAPGLMAAVLGLDEEQVASLCAEATAQGGAHPGIAQVANDNCPGQVVISGDRAGMERVMAALTAAGARKVVPLAVSIASHSPLMAPAAEALRAAIDATPIQVSQVPVIGNVSAQPLLTADAIRAELVAQLTGSVRWTASMQYAVAAGATHFVEIGPGDVLEKLVRRIDRTATRRTVNDPESVAGFVAWYHAGQP